MNHLFAQPDRVFARSWMKDEGLVFRLDGMVKGNIEAVLLAQGRNLHTTAVSVEQISTFLGQAVKRTRWFFATCHCALLGELLYASRTGGIYKVNEASGNQRDKLHAPLHALRNTCFHPALVGSSPTDNAAMDRLAYFIERKDPNLSSDLLQNWALLQRQGVAAWSIQTLSAAGAYELQVMGN